MVPSFPLTRFARVTVMLLGGVALTLGYSAQVNIALWVFAWRQHGYDLTWEWQRFYWITAPIGTVSGMLFAYMAHL